MAVKSPYDDLRAAQTLAQGQRLYKKLGRYLSGDTKGVRTAATRRAIATRRWRDEAKEVRRQLEQRFGDTVRLTSATIYATAASGKEGGRARRVEPTWSRRRHFTAPKPDREALHEPYILHVPVDDVTYEPLGVYPNLTDALQVAANLRRVRKGITPGVTYKASELVLLQEELRAVDSTLGSLTVHLKRLMERKRRLERDIEQLSIREQDLGKGMGAPPE